MKPTNQAAKNPRQGGQNSQVEKTPPSRAAGPASTGQAKAVAQHVSRPAGKTSTISVWVPLEIWEKVDILAKALGLFKADIVRWAIYDKMARGGGPFPKTVLGITARRLAKPAVAARIRALTMKVNPCVPARAGKGGRQ